MHEALYYKPEGNKVRCTLCPHNCLIAEGKRGICRIRKNICGSLISENYGQLCSIGTDPIEKKPLYHFFPGQPILSIGTMGCNLNCTFCQNYQISQCGIQTVQNLQQSTPDDIVGIAMNKPDNIGVAYTYNEPVIWFEFVLETAKKVKEAGLFNVMVTNGYINTEPLQELMPWIDAFSVDLKAFTDDFYKKITGSGLAPVLKSLKQIKQAGKHLEITNLVIPNRNDRKEDFQKMVNWICSELGSETVLHISRFFPMYQLDEPQTSKALLQEFFEIARKKMPYVYIGNIRTGKGQVTFCKSCRFPVISRSGYSTRITALGKFGKCQHCGEQIISPDHCN